MIFVTLGTQDKNFTRLLKAIENCESLNNEKIIVQAGYTKYKSKKLEIYNFIEPKQFNQYIKECDLLITHGGVGSIMTGIKNNKKIIAVPRLKKYDEHTNNHQLEIINEFAKDQYLLKVENLNDLDRIINESKRFVPQKIKKENQKMLKLVDSYIEKNGTKQINIYTLIALIFILIITYLIVK